MALACVRLGTAPSPREYTGPPVHAELEDARGGLARTTMEHKISERMSVLAAVLLAAANPGQASAQVQQPPVQQTQAQPQEQAKEQAQPPWDAIVGGELLLELRPRYEYVDQSDKPQQANAFTLRTLLGWETKPYHDFSGVLQLINVTYLLDHDFNSDPATKASSPYPTVPDPNNTNATQMYVEWSGLDKTSIKYGRQIAEINNQRVLGDANFRQTPQTFAALSITNTSVPNTDIYAAYLYRELTTGGTQLGTQTPVGNLRYSFLPGESISGYGIFQDQPNTGQNGETGFSNGSNRILGLRLDGAHPFGDKWKGLYSAEYARQKPYADGNSAIDAFYYHLALGARSGPYYGMVHQEKLSSNNGLYGFQTPLATLHPFQGWADQFVVTPHQGIVDTWVNAGVTVFDKLELYGEYHRFKSDFGSINFGQEIDLSAAYALAKG